MAKYSGNIPFITRYQWVFHLIGIAVVFLMLSLAIQMHKDASVSEIAVDIDPIADNKFLISKKEVIDLINKEVGYDTERGSLKRVDVMQLEYLIDSDPRVNNAEIYIDKHLVIHVEIEQREPIVRIMGNNKSYYLDNEGKYIPLSKSAAIRVLVVTGSIDSFDPDYLAQSQNNHKDIFTIAKAIHQDEFLTALVEQITIDEEDGIVIIPKMGRNKIMVGSIDNIDDKLYRLKIFYKKAISKYGIDKFAELDLQYEDRVFGTPNKS